TEMDDDIQNQLDAIQNDLDTENIDATVNDITTHLNNLESLESLGEISNDPKENLDLPGGNSINYKCLLHFFSKDNDFLNDSASKCSSYIQTISSNGEIKLSSLMNLTSNFKEDTQYYHDLYRFNLALIQFLDTDEFRNASSKVKFNIISSLKTFIKET